MGMRISAKLKGRIRPTMQSVLRNRSWTTCRKFSKKIQAHKKALLWSCDHGLCDLHRSRSCDRRLSMCWCSGDPNFQLLMLRSSIASMHVMRMQSSTVWKVLRIAIVRHPYKEPLGHHHELSFFSNKVACAAMAPTVLVGG